MTAGPTSSTSKSLEHSTLMAYLRRKFDRPFRLVQLETVRGAGYRLRGAPEPWPG